MFAIPPSVILASSLGGGADDHPHLDREGLPLPAGAIARLWSA